MRALACIIAVSSVAHAAPASIAAEELRHDLFDQVVLADAGRDWGTGAITVEHAPSEHDVRLVMTRAIDPARVPAGLRAWRGRKVTVGRDTATCAAQITGLHLLAVIEPGSELGFWDGAVRPLPPHGAVLSIWNDSHAWLVGELSGDCLGRTWVRAANLKVPPGAAPKIVAGPLRDEAIAAFRALPAYRSVQARFHGPGDWDASSGVDPVLRFELPDRTVVSHTAHVRDGQLDEHLLVTWELRSNARPALKLRSIATTSALPPSPLGLTFAMDLRSDGRMLFIYATGESRGALYEVGDKLVDISSLRLATP